MTAPKDALIYGKKKRERGLPPSYPLSWGPQPAARRSGGRVWAALPLSHACRLLPLQLWQLGLQRGVGAEPQAPTHWPSGNLPGDDKLQSLVRKRLRTPSKN